MCYTASANLNSVRKVEDSRGKPKPESENSKRTLKTTYLDGDSTQVSTVLGTYG